VNVYKEGLLHIIKPEMAFLEEELLSVASSPVKLLNNIGEHLIKAGGKRLRPALYFLCAHDAAANDEILLKNKVLPMAASLELIHMATLVHDDVIDNAASRRGKPTTNARCGNHNSVLAGDYFFAKALSNITASSSPKELGIVTDMIAGMCEGEILQNYNSFNPDQTEYDYETRIFKKTANFIATACSLGAIAAKFSDVSIEALRQYGHFLGMAFQITDDILDISATEKEMGKPSGHDIRQGVVTLPVIRALKLSPHSHELKKIIGNPENCAEQTEKAIEIIHASDAVKYSYAKAGEYLEKARYVLPIGLSADVENALLNIVEFVGKRRN
jgi:heptaprenyl diphosphate synthase